MRWVVGDIQGCALEFEALLRAIDFDRDRDELWSTGDLINRGPDSLATLRLWLETGGRGVLGNHEVYALCVRSGAWPRKADTLDALFAAPDADALFQHLRGLPVLAPLSGHDDVPPAWIVHAGIHPRWQLDLHGHAQRINAAIHDDAWLDGPDVTFATRVRCCTVDGRRSRESGPPEACKPPFLPWDSLYRGSTTIVHGHWAFRGYHRTGAVIGLDSGCVYGGPLTAWCQDDDRIVQVPAHKP